MKITESTNTEVEDDEVTTDEAAEDKKQEDPRAAARASMAEAFKHRNTYMAKYQEKQEALGMFFLRAWIPRNLQAAYIARAALHRAAMLEAVVASTDNNKISDSVEIDLIISSNSAGSFKKGDVEEVELKLSTLSCQIDVKPAVAHIVQRITEADRLTSRHEYQANMAGNDGELDLQKYHLAMKVVENQRSKAWRLYLDALLNYASVNDFVGLAELVSSDELILEATPELRNYLLI